MLFGEAAVIPHFGERETRDISGVVLRADLSRLADLFGTDNCPKGQIHRVMQSGSAWIHQNCGADPYVRSRCMASPQTSPNQPFALTLSGPWRRLTFLGWLESLKQGFRRSSTGRYRS
jgi:hypothetical protein